MDEIEKYSKIQREAFNMRIKHGSDAVSHCYLLAKGYDNQLSTVDSSEKEYALMNSRNYWYAVADLLKDSSLPPQ